MASGYTAVTAREEVERLFPRTLLITNYKMSYSRAIALQIAAIDWYRRNRRSFASDRIAHAALTGFVHGYMRATKENADG